jgi:hypothetical protein
MFYSLHHQTSIQSSNAQCNTFLQFKIDALRPLNVIATLCPILLNRQLAYYTVNKSASRDYDELPSLDEGHDTK